MYLSVYSYVEICIPNCFLLRHYSWRNFKWKCQWKKVIDPLSSCSFFRNSCMLRSSLQAKLLAITLMLNQAPLLIATQPTELLLKENKRALEVEKLSVLTCEVSLPDNVTGKVREAGAARTMTANRPQPSLDKRHLSNHPIPLDTFEPLEPLQSAAALQHRLMSLGTEAINPQDKCRLNIHTQTSQHLTVSIQHWREDAAILPKA